jgi:hypothetical protein
MTDLQQHWEGATVAGTYTLSEGLGGDEASQFFRSTTPDGARVVIKMVTGRAAPLDLWHRTRQLRHPNLLELLDYGQTEIASEAVSYAVFEAPDDSLSGAGPLNEAEAREVLEAAIDALRYLHAQGLVIGALDAEHVVAVGDRIKLSTDAVRDAETSAAYREDVLLLGELWRQSLMAASPRSEELATHASDPDPKTRWTLAEIHAALHPAPPPLVEVVPAVVEERVVESPVVAEPVGAEPTPPVFRFPRWILVGTGVFLLILFAFNRSRHADVPPPTAAPTVPVPAPVQQAPAPAAPKATVAANVPKPVPADSNVIWRVIAFTYSSRESAEKKVQQLNQKYPGLRAAVFSPRSRRGYYLVSLGGRMTRDDAVRLQRTARGKGLPRDVYVQNYSD